jgi:hypothetical protein
MHPVSPTLTTKIVLDDSKHEWQGQDNDPTLATKVGWWGYFYYLILFISVS